MTSHSELDNTPRESLGADYERADGSDYGTPDDDDHYYGDDQYDGSDYMAGYQDGYNAALRHMTLRYRLMTAIPYRWRAKYYALRHKLFPHNSDIPF